MALIVISERFREKRANDASPSFRQSLASFVDNAKTKTKNALLSLSIRFFALFVALSFGFLCVAALSFVETRGESVLSVPVVPAESLAALGFSHVPAERGPDSELLSLLRESGAPDASPLRLIDDSLRRDLFAAKQVSLRRAESNPAIGPLVSDFVGGLEQTSAFPSGEAALAILSCAPWRLFSSSFCAEARKMRYLLLESTHISAVFGICLTLCLFGPIRRFLSKPFLSEAPNPSLVLRSASCVLSGSTAYRTPSVSWTHALKSYSGQPPSKKIEILFLLGALSLFALAYVFIVYVAFSVSYSLARASLMLAAPPTNVLVAAVPSDEHIGAILDDWKGERLTSLHAVLLDARKDEKKTVLLSASSLSGRHALNLGAEGLLSVAPSSASPEDFALAALSPLPGSSMLPSPRPELADPYFTDLVYEISIFIFACLVAWFSFQWFHKFLLWLQSVFEEVEDREAELSSVVEAKDFSAIAKKGARSSFSRRL